MVYDEKLAGRIRKKLAKRQGVTERKMFGGIAFLTNGNMCCGVLKNNLIIRTGPQNYEKTLKEPNVRPMDFTGRPLRGFVFVGPAGYQTEKDLTNWVKRAVDFTSSLPAK
jgi:TfoX/Sxy family transcriptional regulator of competence genes